MENTLGSLKSFFNSNSLKNLVVFLVICILLALLEFTVRYLNPSILERMFKKELCFIDFFLNYTKQ